MASFNTNNPYGDRESGGGREHGRRGLPGTARHVIPPVVPVAAAAPSTTSTAATTTSNPQQAASNPPPRLLRSGIALAIRSSPAPSPAPEGVRPPGSHGPLPRPSPALPDLEPRAVEPDTFLTVGKNNMKLDRAVGHGAILPGDELRFNNGSNTIRAVVPRIFRGSFFPIEVLDPVTGERQRLYPQDGAAYFRHPADIVGAFTHHYGGRSTQTPWVALDLYRSGQRVGNLSEIRERMRLAGSRGRGVATTAEEVTSREEETVQTTAEGAEDEDEVMETVEAEVENEDEAAEDGAVGNE